MNELTEPFAPSLLANLRAASQVLALTGAGISAESGVPTFRDAQTGLWAKFKPEDLATVQAFERQPQVVWEWYAWRRQWVAQAKPNPGHLALAEMERRVPHFTLVTQNVDGLHHLAGSRNVIEVHGNIMRTKCFREEVLIERWDDSGERPPRCPRCGGPLRPDVFLFGEMLPPGAFERAAAAAASCQVCLAVGTSAVVQPAASLPLLAKQHGALFVEVNPDSTPLTQEADFSLRGLAGVILPALVKAAWDAEQPSAYTRVETA